MAEEKKRVFVIDDDEELLRIAKRTLEKAGFEVETSSHTIGVTKSIMKFVPHIVLVDVMMPALKGTKVIEILRKSLDPLPPVLLYSNKSPSELKELAIDSGADDYICKTDGPSALVRKVRTYLI